MTWQQDWDSERRGRKRGKFWWGQDGRSTTCRMDQSWPIGLCNHIPLGLLHSLRLRNRERRNCSRREMLKEGDEGEVEVVASSSPLFCKLETKTPLFYLYIKTKDLSLPHKVFLHQEKLLVYVSCRALAQQKVNLNPFVPCPNTNDALMHTIIMFTVRKEKGYARLPKHTFWYHTPNFAPITSCHMWFVE